MNGKTSALAVVFGTVLAIQLGFKLFDIAEDEISDPADRSDIAVSEEIAKAIIEGQDPTDLLEPTAAGSRDKHALCRSGKIIGDQKTQALDDAYYVAFNEGASLIIQVSPWIPTYLIQGRDNVVSAIEYHPDAETISKLGQLFSNRDQCQLVDLYLSHIESPAQG